MSKSFKVMCEEFRNLVEKHFVFLLEHGFQRSFSDEQDSPTGCCVRYLGKNVGVLISLDIRDNDVSVQVARVNNGVLTRNWEGGYSSSLFMHLVNYTGYRGGMPWPTRECSIVEKMVIAQATLLLSQGEAVLKDRPDSLPLSRRGTPGA
jgi:hypothetical protein